MSASTWLIIAIVCGAVEILTVGFWFLWMAIAALVCAGGVALGILPSLESQLLVFAIISLLLIIFTRPLLKKAIRHNDTASNTDALIGQQGIVIQPISPLSFGQVKLNGEIWTAAADGNIDEETIVTVLAIDGVKLIVKPAEAE